MMQKILKFMKSSYRKLTGYPHLINGVIFLFTAGVFFVLSYFTPYVYDDIVYHYRYIADRSFFDIRPGETPLIASWADIFASVNSAWFSWGGRAIAMFTIYAVLWGGKMLFNLLNSIMAALVISMICRHICGREPIKPALLLTVAGVFFLCAPSPGLTLFWANGAVIYLWTSLFYLILLYPYRLFMEYGDDRISGLRRWYLIPSGIIGCSANENVAVAVIIVIAAVIIYAKLRQNRIPSWMLCGLCGAVIGGAVLLFAPGVSARIAYEGYQGIAFFQNIFTQTAHVFHTVPALFTATVMMLIFGRRRIPASQWPLTVFYLLLISGISGSMIFSPYTPGRALFGAFIFMLCCAGKTFQQLEIREFAQRIVAGITVIMFLTNAAFALRDITFTGTICRNRFAAMQNAQQNQQSTEWIFRPACGLSRYNALYKTDIMREDPNHFLNRHYALKYGQKSVRITPVPAIQGMENRIFPGGEW
ncbi:MAG: hypothetical protein IKC94_00380 [Lentisphaeria bacterium]|nr:hypothetical protein [Lentisphaeria bacterium]